MKQMGGSMLRRRLAWLKMITVSMVGMSLIVLPTMLAEAAKPGYDVTGIWDFAGATGAMFQNGNDVKMVLVGKGYSHFFEGDYTDAKTIKGKYIRRNPEGCITSMSVTITVNSATALSYTWQGLDSYCDLKEGQTGNSSAKKIN